MNTNTLYSKLYEVQAIELKFAVTTEKKQFSSLHVNVKPQKHLVLWTGDLDQQAK